jgi:tetratricopeptide (TPR) repeat protein
VRLGSEGEQHCRPIATGSKRKPYFRREQREREYHYGVGLIQLDNNIYHMTGTSPNSAGTATTARIAAVSVVELIESYRRALHVDPNHPIQKVNLALALRVAGQAEESRVAAVAALRTLDLETMRPTSDWDASCLLSSDPAFASEWNGLTCESFPDPHARARARERLIRARLHLTLGELSNDPAHFYEVVLARPGWPVGRAALGCALARAGRIVEAMPHLREAVQADPLDRAAARALGSALLELGEASGHAALTASRGRTHATWRFLIPFRLPLTRISQPLFQPASSRPSWS